MTTTQQIANDINTAHPLLSSPEPWDAAWDVVSGTEGNEYFSRSPYATITQYDRGFVVHNLVVGSQYPCALWSEANKIRVAITSRYQAINNCRY
jgi:hypothetical protein